MAVTAHPAPAPASYGDGAGRHPAGNSWGRLTDCQWRQSRHKVSASRTIRGCTAPW